MQIGDLVRVYHFSHTARRHYKARMGLAVETYIPDDLDGHVTGLIISESEDEHTVLIPAWQTREIYATDRLEVISNNKPFGKSQK